MMLNSLLLVIHTESKLAFIAFIECHLHDRHTNEMICKLESAGLGFFVKASETKQKLGML